MPKLSIDFLNIVLMLFSALLAYFLPFELFLFVYAFLGPLHYLTEINWLKERNFFTTSKYDYLLFVIIIVIIGLFLFIPFLKTYNSIITILIAFAFFSAFGLQYFDDVLKKKIFISLCLFVSILLFLVFKQKSILIFSIFLPTLIHVFIFTGLFILAGAIKNNNVVGKLSLLVFIISGLLLLFLPQYNLNYSVTNFTINLYQSFVQMNKTIINFFFDNSTDVFNSAIGIKIMRFIAFSYTYHYLNWFSKTSIIQWHKTSKSKLIAIVSFWILSVTIYLVDYKLGLKILFLLSLGHVLLEFPLNFKTLTIIKNKLK